MEIKLKDKTIQLSEDEAKQIEEILLTGGAEFIKIGDEIINSKYIIGIFNSATSIPIMDKSRIIEAPKKPKEDFKKVEQILQEMRKGLEEKGIIK